MEATCRRALEVGLPAVAFTEHVDFVEGVHADLRPLEVESYWLELERCRALFPQLRILSGVELGEPHLFADRAAAVLAQGPLDRILGSAHCFPWQGQLMDASQLSRLAPSEAPEAVRSYLVQTLALAESAQPFAVLAHLDYYKRYWPHDQVPYRPHDFEEETRAVLRALAATGRALEVNTTRGMEPARGLCPGPEVLGWWLEEGGRAVCFGSDSHDPARVGFGLELAAQVVEAAGFRADRDPVGFWLR